MTTFSELITSRTGAWAIYAQVEGLGPHLSSSDLTAAGGDARTRFCVSPPAWAASEPSSLWRSDLFTFPDILSERADEIGGVSEYGAAQVSLLDRDDYITGLLRLNDPPITTLTADLSATATSASVGTTSPMSAASVLWVDGEAMRVSTTPAGTSVSIERGYLGTQARPHKDGADVFAFMPYIRGRKLEIYVAPLYATDRAERELVGSYSIDRCRWAEVLNCWVLGGRSEIQAIDSVIPALPRTVEVVSLRNDAVIGQGGYVELTPANSPGNGVSDFRLWTGTEASQTLFYLANGDEVLGIEAETVIHRSVLTGRRGIAGTQPEDLEVGAYLPQVFCAESQASSFRWSPGPSPSTSRSSGTWNKSDHWVDICLCLLLSSAHPDDGLELTNYVSARGNWSVLPPGYGAGVLATEIDWDSWLDAKQRTQELRFPNFVLGREPMSIGKIITEEFLRPVGAYLTATNGTIRVVLPASPLAGVSAASVGADEILRRPGSNEPDADFELDLASETAEVRFEIGPSKIPVSARTIRGGRDAKSDVIPVPSAGESQSPVWGLVAEARLATAYRPAITGRIAVDYSLWSAAVGSVLSISLAEVPALRGARGWTSVQALLREREVRMDSERGVWIEHRVRGYGEASRVGRISASGYIDSVSSVTATLLPNIYTCDDAAGGLPVTDAAAFDVGWICYLVNPDGTDAGGGTQEVVSISGNDVELDGDFSGALASGLILEFASASEVVAEQLASYAFLADEQSILVDGGEPYVFGER